MTSFGWQPAFSAFSVLALFCRHAAKWAFMPAMNVANSGCS